MTANSMNLIEVAECVAADLARIAAGAPWHGNSLLNIGSNLDRIASRLRDAASLAAADAQEPTDPVERLGRVRRDLEHAHGQTLESVARLRAHLAGGRSQCPDCGRVPAPEIAALEIGPYCAGDVCTDPLPEAQQ